MVLPDPTYLTILVAFLAQLGTIFLKGYDLVDDRIKKSHQNATGRFSSNASLSVADFLILYEELEKHRKFSDSLRSGVSRSFWSAVGVVGCCALRLLSEQVGGVTQFLYDISPLGVVLFGIVYAVYLIDWVWSVRPWRK